MWTLVQSIFQNSFTLNGTELCRKLKIQGLGLLKIIKKFLTVYPDVKSKNKLEKATSTKKVSKRQSAKC